jgi:hypothetical protein
MPLVVHLCLFLRESCSPASREMNAQAPLIDPVEVGFGCENDFMLSSLALLLQVMVTHIPPGMIIFFFWLPAVERPAAAARRLLAPVLGQSVSATVEVLPLLFVSESSEGVLARC